MQIQPNERDKIAMLLVRSKSTISEEIKRNNFE